MPDDPIAWAREQAARAEPVVHAAAMLWIARVQTALDSGLARITFEMALEETRRRSGRDCEKRRFYEKVALVKGDLLFFRWAFVFGFGFGYDACCSPPCFYTHSL